ncbi:MAG: hypothetical protein ABEL04_11455 [Salinibacter sp.]|uniref:hypothetical protein n=1 Tax=Salinibacter sp. TaxID=2065818 RepID=UPI0035D3E053
MIFYRGTYKLVQWGLTGLLALLVPVAHAHTVQDASGPPNPRMVAGVHVDEQAGPLADAEEALLRRLSEKMIPLPDTIRVRVDSVHYGVYSPLGGKIILLSTDRFRAPDSLSRTSPYLFGRTEATPPRSGRPPPRYTHTLAHELAHFIVRRLSAPHPRPAWGTARTPRKARLARELEAELVAAVLQEIAFGTRWSALGYPDSVDTPGLPPRETGALIQEYRGILADTWRLPAAGAS